MKIEILTRNTGKKPEIMTYLKALEGFASDGNKVAAKGVEAEITGSYMLFTTAMPWLADELIRLIFEIRPVPFSSGFYEITADHRIIITCPAKSVNHVLSALEVLEHLDHREGELAGRIVTRWNSRDVGISAQYEIIIQGGVAVVRVKFVTHFRESEFHCRGVIAMVSLCPGLSVFSALTKDTAKPPEISSVKLTAKASVSGEDSADFLNTCPGTLDFLEMPGIYQVKIGGRNNLIQLIKTGENRAEMIISLEEPWLLDDTILEALGNISGLKEAEIVRVIDSLILSPEDLLKSLDFVKDKAFASFSARLGDMEAVYDIAGKKMIIRAVIPWDRLRASEAAFSGIEEYTVRVMTYAV